MNITEGFSKKNDYTEEELNQLKEMNIKGKQNFIRCYNKVDEPEFKYEEVSQRYADFLVKEDKQEGNHALNCYLKALYLLKLRYLTDSLEWAEKAYEIGKSDDCLDLIKRVKKEIEAKNLKAK